MMLPLLIGYFRLNVHGAVSVRHMIGVISSTLEEERFPFTWKADVIHLLEADWSVEPFMLLLYSVQWLFDESSFPL